MSLFHLYQDLPRLAAIAAGASNINFLRNRKNLPKNKGNEICILGNGPSLKEDLHHILENEQNTSFFCVNHFADSDYFEQLRPDYYCFLDPYFWSRDALSSYKKKVSITLANIKEKVDWPMQIFIPSQARGDAFASLEKIGNITVTKYNNIDSRLSHRGLERLLLKTRFITPRAINVVQHAIYMSMMMGYGRIRVYGIDATVYKCFETDQQNNEVCQVQQHFYGQTRTKAVASGTVPRTMEECLLNESRIFRGFATLEDLSKEMKVEIINCSSNSMVDSFKRRQQNPKD